MNLHHLAIFHAIAKCSSVSAASRELHVSQPAISRQLHELESRLGVELFERRPRGMQLTEVGRLLLHYSKRIFALERSAESAVHDYLDLDVGSLEIGASQTIGNYLLPAILARFRVAHPRIRLTLDISNTASVAEGVDSYQYAVGFVEGPLPDGDFEVMPLRRDRIVPLVASGHALASTPPESLGALAQQPILLRERGSGSRQVIEEAFARHALKINCAGEIGSSEALLRAAVAGVGVAWLSELGAATDLANGTVVKLPTHGLQIERGLNLIRVRDRHLSPSAAALIGLCKEHECEAAELEPAAAIAPEQAR